VATHVRDFIGRPDQVRAARRFVAQLIPRAGVTTVAQLLVSEAVTNALLHSASGREGGVFRISCSVDRGVLRVSVRDGGAPTPPRRRVHGLESVTGRGLELFDALAARWGVEGGPAGRTVWFELLLDQEARDGADDRTLRSGPARP
jgi:serine/threonine-protein kinase RsbW